MNVRATRFVGSSSPNGSRGAQAGLLNSMVDAHRCSGSDGRPRCSIFAVDGTRCPRNLASSTTPSLASACSALTEAGNVGKQRCQTAARSRCFAQLYQKQTPPSVSPDQVPYVWRNRCRTGQHHVYINDPRASRRCRKRCQRPCSPGVSKKAVASPSGKRYRCQCLRALTLWCACSHLEVVDTA